MDLMNYIDRGGIIVYILIFLNVLGFAIMFWKLLQLMFIRKLKLKIVKSVVFEFQNEVSSHKDAKIMNYIDLKVKELESGLNIIKIIASIAPLLGLLGTVIGVLNAFDAISAKGLGDNAAFAGGISVALITTVAGLIVAIPHFIGYNFFISKIDKIELEIQKEVLKSV